jgi:hypothetical protein
MGTFDTAVTPGTPLSRIVPAYFGNGPGNTTVNLRLSKTFGFGREKKSGGGNHGPRMRPGLRGSDLSGSGAGIAGFFGGTSSDRAYNLTFSVMARNLLNSVNPGRPVGNLSSPFFGQAVGSFSSSSANRRVDLQVMFSF